MQAEDGARRPRLRRAAPWVALAIVAGAALGAGVRWLGRGRTPAEEPAPAGVVRHREGSLRYQYHILTGGESLCDLAVDRGCARNLLRERPDEARRLRRDLERKLGLGSLDELRSADREKIERLRSLGYL